MWVTVINWHIGYMEQYDIWKYKRRIPRNCSEGTVYHRSPSDTKKHGRRIKCSLFTYARKNKNDKISTN